MSIHLAPTELAPGVWLVRFHPDRNTPYDKMIVVTESDDNETLILQGWIGQPLSRTDWREARAELFPLARRVLYERRKDGESRWVKHEFNV